MGEREELRVQCRLVWNGWPDSEQARGIIAAHEAKDTHSRDAWDRVITAIESCGRAQSAPAPTDRAKLVDELMAFHNCCTQNSTGGDGEFRVECSSGSDAQARALRSVLRQAAAALRAPEAADAGAVAYRYTLRGVQSFSPTRLPESIALGWHETPLYASPTDAGMRERAADKIDAAMKWPAGCHSANSCDRNQQCMYVNCRYEHQDIKPDIAAAKSALATTSTDGNTGDQRS